MGGSTAGPRTTLPGSSTAIGVLERGATGTGFDGVTGELGTRLPGSSIAIGVLGRGVVGISGLGNNEAGPGITLPGSSMTIGVLGHGIMVRALDAGLESFTKSLGSIHSGSGMIGDSSLFWICLAGSAQG